MVRGADEQNRAPVVIAQDVVDVDDVLIGVRRSLLEEDGGRGHALADGLRQHVLRLEEAVRVSGREDQIAGLSAPIQIDRRLEPLGGAAAGFRRFPDTAGEDDDRVGRPRRVDDLQRRRHPPEQVRVEDQHVHGRHRENRRGGVRPRPAVHAAQRFVPTPLRCVAPLEAFVDQSIHGGNPSLPTVFLRHRDAALHLGPGRVVEHAADRRRECVGVARHGHHAAVFGVEAPDLRQIGGHDRQAHDQVLVELRRVDVRGVLGEPVRHDPDVEPFDVSRDLIVRPLAEQPDVRAALERRHVGLRRADERECRLGHSRCDGGEEILIDPLMQAADVADHGAAQRLQVGRRRGGAVAHALEPLQADTERKQMHARAETGGALAQLLGRDEDEIGFLEQPLFTRHDAPGGR